MAAAYLLTSVEKTHDWVKLHLGLLRSELDRAFVGLDLTSKGMQNRAEMLDHAGLGAGSGTELDPNQDSGHCPRSRFGLRFGSRFRSNFKFGCRTHFMNGLGSQ